MGRRKYLTMETPHGAIKLPFTIHQLLILYGVGQYVLVRLWHFSATGEFRLAATLFWLILAVLLPPLMFEGGKFTAEIAGFIATDIQQFIQNRKRR